MTEKVTFDDLSIGLKVAVVFAWVFGIINIIAFFIGFIEGLVYY